MSFWLILLFFGLKIQRFRVLFRLFSICWIGFYKKRLKVIVRDLFIAQFSYIISIGGKIENVRYYMKVNFLNCDDVKSNMNE